MWILVEQSLSAHDHAVHAKAALGGLFIDERFLDGVRMRNVPQPLKRRDAPVLRSVYRKSAGTHRTPVHNDGARPALPQAAAKSRAIQLQIVAQDI
jgi:hypothetical protein